MSGHNRGQFLKCDLFLVGLLHVIKLEIGKMGGTYIATVLTNCYRTRLYLHLWPDAQIYPPHKVVKQAVVLV